MARQPAVLNRLRNGIFTAIVGFTGAGTTPALHAESILPVSPMQQSAHSNAVYETLIAEFALHRQAYDTSLHHYFMQAFAQRDVYLAERATRLAMHQDAALEFMQASTLWRNLDPAVPEARFFNAIAFAYNQKTDLALEQMRFAQMLGHPTDFTRITNRAIKNQQPLLSITDTLLLYTSETPNSADLHLALALTYQEAQDIPACDQHLNHALIANTDNIAIFRYVAQVYLQIDQPSSAMATMRKATDTHPYNFQLRWQYAMLATRVDHEVARHQLEFLVNINPGHGPTVFNLALLYLDADEFDAAQELLEHQLQINFEADNAHYYLGQIAGTYGKWKDAIFHLSRIQSPEDPAALNLQLIHFHILNGNLAAAETLIAVTDKLVVGTQRNELATRHASIWRLRGNLDRAYQILSNALASQPDAELYFQRAIVADHQNQPGRVERNLQEAVNWASKHKQPHVDALHELAMLKAQQGYEQDALTLLTQAYQVSPDNPMVLDSMGWVLYRMGQLDQALMLLTQSMARRPNARVASHLGEVLWMLGRKNEATQVLREALLETPDHQQLQETIKRLNVPPHQPPTTA